MLDLEKISQESIEKAAAIIDDNDVELDVEFIFEREVWTGNPDPNYEFGTQTKKVACKEEEATRLVAIPSVDGYTSTIVYERPFADEKTMIGQLSKELYYTYLNMSE